MRFGKWKNDMILLIMNEVVVRKSHVCEPLAMKPRGKSSIKRRGKEIYAVVCVGMGAANLLSGQCCVNYYHKVLENAAYLKSVHRWWEVLGSNGIHPSHYQNTNNIQIYVHYKVEYAQQIKKGCD